MDMTELNAVKDKIYEAEGLLELLQLRPDKLSELAPLISARIEEASQKFALLSQANSSEAEVGFGGVEIGEKVGFGDAEVGDEVDEVDEVEEVEDEVEEDEVEEVDESESEEVEDTLADSILTSDIDLKSRVESRESREPRESREEARAPIAFCLNDRFRFRRALFGGSDANFNEAVASIQSMHSYPEAEEYFLGECGLDPQNEDVQAFMEIIRNYFER